jgi:UDP-N-acetyl-D-glucosamine/UDP-N-acetyl-D-galactosamine dehydrogenase
MIRANKQINSSTVAIFGITFKENCPDVRNTKVIEVIRELEEYGVEVKVVDPIADKEDLWHEYRLNLCGKEQVRNVDAVIFAVPHDEFKDINLEQIKEMFGNKEHVVINEVAAASESGVASVEKDCVMIDIKGMFNRQEAEQKGFLYWRL